MSEPVEGQTLGGVRGKESRRRRGLRIAILTKELVALLGVVFAALVWNADPGDDDPPPSALIAVQAAHSGCSDAINFSHDGRTLLTGGLDSRVRFWEPDDAAPRGGFQESSGVLASAFSPDGRWLVLSLSKGGLELWDCEEQLPAGPLIPEAGVIRAVGFSEQGRLAAAGLDGVVRLIDVENRSVLAELRGHREPIHTLAFTPDGTRLVTGGLDGLVNLWDAAEGRILRTHRDPRGAVLRVACSPDGRTLAWSVRSIGAIRLWDLAEDRPIGSLAGHAQWTTCLAFSPDGQRIVSAGGDHRIRVWDLASREEVGEARLSTAWARGMALSPDGQRLAVAGDDGSLSLWKVSAIAQPASDGRAAR